MNEQLTDEQVAHWRQILITIVGPYALHMPREQVQAFRDKMQAQIDEGKVLDAPEESK